MDNNTVVPAHQIPKVIHYCWFGKGEMSDLMKMCVASWRKFCPDWEIVEWNEDNFDVNFCPYAKKAFREKRYGFLVDPARMKIIFERGGVYLDTDVELLQPIDTLLSQPAFFGYGLDAEVNPGSGFGAEKGNPFIKKLLDEYMQIPEYAPYRLGPTRDTEQIERIYPQYRRDYTTQHFEDVVFMGDLPLFTKHHYTQTWMSPFQKWKSQNPLWQAIRKLVKKLRKA